MHNQAMTMDGPRLKQPRFNTKKKLMIYIALAATYLIVVMVAGLVMDPEMYGVHYEDSFLAPSLAHPFGTDIMGRDMFWRSVKGLSNSILIGLAASAVSSVIAGLWCCVCCVRREG